MGLLASELPQMGDIWVWHPGHNAARVNKAHRGPAGTRLYSQWLIVDDPLGEGDRQSKWIRIHMQNVDTGYLETEYTVGDWYVWDDHWRLVERNGYRFEAYRFTCGGCGSRRGSNDPNDYLCLACRLIMGSGGTLHSDDPSGG